jgi:hypothetical protein
MTTLQERIDTRVPGIALIAGAAIGLFAMLHHPVPGGRDFTAWAANVERLAVINQMVHGTMIVLVAILTWTLLTFSIRRGFHRPLVLLGTVAWAIGAVAMIVAPSYNGFVIVGLARRALAAPETSDMLAATVRAMTAGVAVIAVVGALGMSAAILLWSADLTTSPGRARWTGLLGLAAGAAPIVALATGGITLNTIGMTLVLASWVAWFAALGALMMQRRV